MHTQPDIPGKLFLAGEYAVLSPGEFAVVLAVNRTMRVTVEPAAATRIGIPQWSLDLTDLDGDADDRETDDPREAFVRRLVAATREHVDAPRRFHLTVEPHGRDLLGRDLGLGTSAALAVALARAMAPDSDDTFAIALHSHAAVQGTRSSGADVAASFAGTSVVFRQAASAESLPQLMPASVPQKLPFAALFSGQSQRTAEAVRGFDQARADDPTTADACLDAIRTATRAVIDALPVSLPQTIIGLNGAADALQQLADFLGAPPPVDPALQRAIRDRGAAIKSSGAIGGDCALIVAPSLDALGPCIERAVAAGYEHLPLQPQLRVLPAEPQ